MQSFSAKLFATAASLVLGFVTFAAAQTPNTSDWETLRPEGEEFTVQMPKGSTLDSSKEPYHKMELNTRTYLSMGPAGPVFAVVSLSGIKSNPALYTEMQRINSYVDAFKTLFSPKVRKDAVAKLTLVGNKSLQGNAGREYRMTLGNLSGTVNVFATKKRFYSIVFLNTKKDDALQDQFLSSFMLPDKYDAPTVATEMPATGQPSLSAATTTPEAEELATKRAAAAKESADTKPDEANRTSAITDVPRAPISGGVLNGKAISLPAPEYPAIAKQGKASGTVVVQVTIDENGSVISAHATSGHPLLQGSAVAAARQAKFSPTLLMGEPVKVTGVIVYNFGEPLN